jgi:hypothetical protein
MGFSVGTGYQLGLESGAQQVTSSANPTTTGATTNTQATRAVNRPTAVTSPKAEPLLIEAEERSYMLCLADAVGKSPRRLKRFVNTYRILKGSIDALARESFVVHGGQRGSTGRR